MPGGGVSSADVGGEDGAAGELSARLRLLSSVISSDVSSFRFEGPGDSACVGVSMDVVLSSSLTEPESESDTGIGGFPFPFPLLFTLLPLPPLFGRRTDSVPFLLRPGSRRIGVDMASSSSDVSDDSLSSPRNVP